MKKSSAISFVWGDLIEKMKADNVTSKVRAKSAAELAELYSGKTNVKFNTSWNVKPDNLLKVGDAAAAKYYVKK